MQLKYFLVCFLSSKNSFDDFDVCRFGFHVSFFEELSLIGAFLYPKCQKQFNKEGSQVSFLSFSFIIYLLISLSLSFMVVVKGHYVIVLVVKKQGGGVAIISGLLFINNKWGCEPYQYNHVR